MNVANLLRDRVAAMPDAVATIDYFRGKSREFSFLKLDRAAGQAAALFHQAGLKQGDTVLLFCPMSAELYIVLAALFRLGLVAMFVDPSASRKQLKFMLEGMMPRAFVGGRRAQLLRWFDPTLRQIPVTFCLSNKFPGAIPLSASQELRPWGRIVPCTGDSPALITFSSGTGGPPKAALRTHGFLQSQLAALTQCVDFTAGQIDLVTLPIFVLANLASGLTSLIPDVALHHPGSVKAARLIELIQRHAASQIGGSPALLTRMVEFCRCHQVKLNGLRRVHTGGGPVSPQLLEDLSRYAPAADIKAIYGSTEAEPIACLGRDELQTSDFHATSTGHGLLLGRPVPTLQLRIMKDQWGKPIGPFSESTFAGEWQPTGRSGEIVVSGAHVLGGYLNSDHDRWIKFNVGPTRWHRTGDAGYLDPLGRLWLLGRCSEAIPMGLDKIYPLAVEQIALRHPEIRNAAFVLVKGERTLILEPRRSRADPSQFQCLRQQIPFAGIQQIRTVRRIPLDRRHSAKVDYSAVRSLFEARS